MNRILTRLAAFGRSAGRSARAGRARVSRLGASAGLAALPGLGVAPALAPEATVTAATATTAVVAVEASVVQRPTAADEASAAQQPVTAGEASLKERLEHVADSVAYTMLAERITPGLSVAVAHEGEIVLHKGYGLADVENGVAARPETVYRIGSITKQFTASAVMQMVERGRIDLEGPITRWLPDYPLQGHDVRVRHLLNHTSGIKSYTGLGECFWERVSLDLTDEELIALFQDEPFKPFVEDGITHDEVLRMFEEAGLGLPSYYEWRSRSSCHFCFYQTKQEWVSPADRHPELFDRATAIERKPVIDAGVADHTENAIDGNDYTWARGMSVPELKRRRREFLDAAKARAEAARASEGDLPLSQLFADPDAVDEAYDTCTI